MSVLNIIPEPYRVQLTEGTCRGNALRQITCVVNENYSDEEYSLTVTPDGIEIVSSSPKGEYYAKTTLRQLENNGGIPCCTIYDKPKYSYRGFMVDSARHMQTVDELKKYIEAASFFKFNVFHWHLTDDQGWRIESEAFPELNRIGSYRKSSDFGKNHIAETYGGYYTKEQIREIVDFCAQRYIDVVPEIDMPGHTSAAIASYKHLSCREEQINVETRQGIYKNILCCGKESTFDFIFAVLDEVMELFPYEYVHIGGDEAPKNRWNNCPFCQRRMRDLHLKNSEELQGWFINRVVAYLASHGKKAITWNESLKSGILDASVTVQNWMDKDKLCPEWTNRGGKMIVSDFYHYYLDYPYAMTPLKKTLSYDPVVDGVTSVGAENILGVEAPIWTEYISDFSRLTYMCFPRLAAVANTGWYGYPDENGTFEKSFSALTSKLNGIGIVAARYDEWNPNPIKRLTGTLGFFTGTLSKEVIRGFVFPEKDD